MASNLSRKVSPALVSLRPAVPGDEQFLFELYASTRAEEMAAWGWGPEQQQAFLTMQFRAQQMHYEAAYAGADHDIILVEGSPSGRMMVSRADGIITLVDIALLTEYRCGGIGTFLINGLIDGARRVGSKVELHVVKTNPAFRLYERLGFSIVEDAGVYLKMECCPTN